MATGASMNMHKRRTGLRTQSSMTENAWQRSLGFLGGLSRKLQIALGAGVILCLLGVGLGFRSSAANAYLPLYPIPLAEQDVREVSQALTRRGLEHTVPPTMDQIMIHPSERLQARAHLAGLSLPRNRPPKPNAASKISRTRLEQLEAQRSQLENELAYTITQMEEIDDARVQLAFPEKTFFQDDSKAVTASVFLRVHGGRDIGEETARGIASLVSHSVPELNAESVSILDHRGGEIQAKKEPENLYDEVQAQKERRLQEKLQMALGRIYGDRAHAVVDLTLDFSQEEQRRYTPGSPADDGMVKDSIQLVHEMLEGATQEESKKYDQKKEAVNYKYTENYFAKLRKQAKVERITATVLIDGGDPKHVDQIKDLVKGAIGIDEVARHDAVFVSMLPWNRPMGLWDKPVTPVALGTKEKEPGGGLPPMVAVIVGMLLLGATGIFLTRRFSPVLGVEMGGGAKPDVHGIVDHGTSKDGRTTTFESGTTTNVSKVEALERLVGQEPTKAASLLKSTWLSDN